MKKKIKEMLAKRLKMTKAKLATGLFLLNRAIYAAFEFQPIDPAKADKGLFKGNETVKAAAETGNVAYVWAVGVLFGLSLLYLGVSFKKKDVDACVWSGVAAIFFFIMSMAA